MAVLLGRTVLLRPVTACDLPDLVKILHQPEVARWWPGYDLERLEREFLDSPHLAAFAVMVGSDVIGSAQYCESLVRETRQGGIDVFLDVSWQGKGLGSDSIRALARHLLYEQGLHRVTSDPPTAHVAAVRAYRRVGFKPIGTAREYARDVDGTWGDALLMDLVKQDLQ